MFNLRIRYARVVRFIPSRAAAPLGGANRNRRLINDRLADESYVAAGGKVHDSVGAILDRLEKLLQFIFNIGRHGGIDDHGVDLASSSDADTHRLEIEVVHVGGDDHSPTSDFIPDEFRFQLLPLCYVPHLPGNYSGTGVVDLRVILGHFAAHVVRSLHLRLYSGAGRLADAIVAGLLNPSFGLLALAYRNRPMRFASKASLPAMTA